MSRKLIIPFHVPQDQPTFCGCVFFQPKTQFSNQRTWVLCDWRNAHVLVSHDPFNQKTLFFQNGCLIWIYFDPPEENWVLRRWVWGFTQINRSKIPKNHVLGCNKRPLRVSRGFFQLPNPEKKSTRQKKTMWNNQIRLLVFSCSDFG